MERAAWEFIGFVDNDDWIFPEIYERLHRFMLDYDAEIGRCDDMQGEIEPSVSSADATILVTESEKYFALLYQDIWEGHVTDRLFRRGVIGDTHFLPVKQ